MRESKAKRWKERERERERERETLRWRKLTGSLKMCIPTLEKKITIYHRIFTESARHPVGVTDSQAGCKFQLHAPRRRIDKEKKIFYRQKKGKENVIMGV